MPDTYVIESLGQKAVWENEQNKGDYPVKFVGKDPEVLVFHDSDSKYPAPKVGDELFGDVQKDKRGRFRFRRASRQDSGGYGPRQSGRDDVTGKSIERQTAAKAAAEMAAAAGGDAPTMVANFEAMFDTVIAKIHGASQSAPKPPDQLPVDREGLEPQPALAGAGDADIPF